MTERTRQIVLGVFLVGVLAVTVGAVWLFADHRQKQVTTLGPMIRSESLGFSIRMPKDWERVPVSANLFGPCLVYMRHLEAQAGHDRMTNQMPQRHIFFLITPPGGTPEQVLEPLAKLVQALNISDNYFNGYQISWLGEATQTGNYLRRKGNIRARVYERRILPYPIELGRYEQITAENQVFWCVIYGNTQINAADEALLEAVVGSFSKIGEQANSGRISTTNGSLQGG